MIRAQARFPAALVPPSAAFSREFMLAHAGQACGFSLLPYSPAPAVCDFSFAAPLARAGRLRLLPAAPTRPVQTACDSLCCPPARPLRRPFCRTVPLADSFRQRPDHSHQPALSVRFSVIRRGLSALLDAFHALPYSPFLTRASSYIELRDSSGRRRTAASARHELRDAFEWHKSAACARHELRADASSPSRTRPFPQTNKSASGEADLESSLFPIFRRRSWRRIL